MNIGNRVRGLMVLVLVLAATAAAAQNLPREAPAKGSLDKWPQPNGSLVAYRLFERGKHTFVGLATADDRIVWQRDAGIRPMVDVFWSTDGKALLVVTDCVQKEAELHSLVPTASWLMVFDATKNWELTAQGDLDTDVLDLAHKLPDAVGAAHEVDRVTLENGVIKATVKHRGAAISGEAPLAALAKKYPLK